MMQQRNIFLIMTMLLVFAVPTAALCADDTLEGLDSTMRVLDDVGSLQDELAEIGDLDNGGVNADAWEDEADDIPDEVSGGGGAEDTDGESISRNKKNDGFEVDEIDEIGEMEAEDDFEDGDDVDLDQFADDELAYDDGFEDGIDD